MRIVRALGMGLCMWMRVRRCLKRFFLRPLFAHVGRGFVFDPDGLYSYGNICVGDDVYIGPGARISAAGVGVEIRDWVIIGPGLTIMAGDHNTTVPGVPMRHVKGKAAGNDRRICIEEDVWIGANVTILKGVTIGRGSIVGAGAVVTKCLPRYCIAAGVPALVIRPRWPWETIEFHEARIYPIDRRSRVSDCAIGGVTGRDPDGIGV